jgi:hypothetical protein
LLHPDAIPEKSTTRERTRRIDDEDPGTATPLTQLANQLIDKRALAGSGRPGDSDHLWSLGPVWLLRGTVDEVGDLTG